MQIAAAPNMRRGHALLPFYLDGVRQGQYSTLDGTHVLSYQIVAFSMG